MSDGFQSWGRHTTMKSRKYVYPVSECKVGEILRLHSRLNKVSYNEEGSSFYAGQHGTRKAYDPFI